MVERKVKDENYYIIHGWMINRLKLKGIQLILYAIIYGFTQDGESEFLAKVQYLSDFTGGASKPTIINALKDLVEKGYIERREILIEGVWYPKYKVVFPIPNNPALTGKEILPAPVKKFDRAGKEILLATGKEILPASINSKDSISDKEEDKERDVTAPREEKDIIELYNTICTSLTPVQILTEARNEAVQKALSKYTIEQITRCFELANSTDFLKGNNERKWKASFDWLIDVDNIAKVIEGNYRANVPYVGFDIDEAMQRSIARSYADSEP